MSMKGKSMFWTTTDHQALVAKGIQILSVMNETNANERKNYLLKLKILNR